MVDCSTVSRWVILATSSLIHEYFIVYRTQQGNGGLFHSEPVGRIGYFSAINKIWTIPPPPSVRLSHFL